MRKLFCEEINTVPNRLSFSKENSGFQKTYTFQTRFIIVDNCAFFLIFIAIQETMRILLSAIYPYLFLLLYLVLPFDDYVRAWPNILMIALAVIFPFVVKKEDFTKLKRSSFLLFLLFAAYLLVNSLVAGGFEDDFSVIGKVFIVLALAILYIPINDIQKIKNAVVFSSLAAITYSVYNFVIITHNLGYFVLGDSPQVIEALLIDRVYLGVLSVISILISFDGISKKYHPLNGYYMANIAINIAFLLLIASRISLLALLVVLIVRQFYGKRKVWRMAIAGMAGLMIVGAFYLIKNKDTVALENQKTPAIVSDFISHSLTYELRAIAWNCAVQVAQESESMWRGIGFKTMEVKQMGCYESQITDTVKRDEFVTKKYNAHNQFLDFYVASGLLGFLLFVIFILSSAKEALPYFLPVAMLVVLVVYALFENVFHRQIGAYYVGLLLLLAWMIPKENKEGENEFKINE